ncbi:hypothetical protein HZH68_008066 [Vespula germanica]|uniref:Uncharacterized protein n=1 Tax=Vespula germanica TaxID=30212 RepID=A0A834K319_VESGE|nr:hypothetical protein HZH68_008066 [Vespula germanica]
MQFNELKLNLCELKQATSGGGCSAKPGEERVGCCAKWGGYDRGGCSTTLGRQLLVIPSVSRGRWELDGAYFRSERKKKDIIAI